MNRVELDPEARTELDAAAEHYEEDYEGRGFRFYAAVERTLRHIASLPDAAPLQPGVAEELGIRRRLVGGFPFAIVYRRREEVIRVIAIGHTRRRPGYWRTRVR